MSAGKSFRINFRALAETEPLYGEHVVTERSIDSVLTHQPEIEDELRATVSGYLNDAKDAQPNDARSCRAPLEIRLHVLKVGQGDAILVEFRGMPAETLPASSTVWLLDAFIPNINKIEAYLQEHMQKTGPDSLLISHFHYDHIRDAPRIIEASKPAVFVPNSIHPTAATRELLAAATRAETLRKVTTPLVAAAGAIEALVLPTESLCQPGDNDPNNKALVVTIRTEDADVLLSGDLKGAYLAQLVRTQMLGCLSKQWRVYKVAHHCSRTGDDASFFSAYDPNLSLTSCAKRNRYGHPHPEPEKKLNRKCHWKTDWCRGQDCAQALQLSIMPGSVLCPCLHCKGCDQDKTSKRASRQCSGDNRNSCPYRKKPGVPTP